LPTTPNLFLAASCYGGLAHALFMRSLLALRPACAARGVGLHTELGGGEALIGRGRAAMMAGFLASPSTHLLFVGADVGFAPDAVFRLLDSGRDVVGGLCQAADQSPSNPVAWEVEPLSPPAESTPDGFGRVAGLGAGLLLISRPAAQRMTDGHPQLRARLGDLQDARSPAATMVFDACVDPASGRYLTDSEAFCHRWRALGGEVWADLRSPLSRVGVAVYGGGTHV
jgi:hypothetical protein